MILVFIESMKSQKVLIGGFMDLINPKDYVQHVGTRNYGRVLKVQDGEAYVVWVKRRRHTWTPIEKLTLSTKEAIQREMQAYPYALSTMNKRFLRGEEIKTEA